MRLIRTVLRPANICLSSQFQVVKTSSDLHLVLNIRWYVRSYANAASSESLEPPKKAGRRLPKYVRKSMVENYVNKYMQTNEGKFPTISEAKKSVGGSYYVVREILQELKYNFKTSSPDTSSVKNDIKKSGELITSIAKVDCNSKSFKPDERTRSSISVDIFLKTDRSEDMGTRSQHPIDEPKSRIHFDTRVNKHETVDEDEHKLHVSLSKAEKQESKTTTEEEEEASENELLKVSTGDADHRTKSSVWQNLKSFANGILSIWRRP